MQNQNADATDLSKKMDVLLCHIPALPEICYPVEGGGSHAGMISFRIGMIDDVVDWFRGPERGGHGGPWFCHLPMVDSPRSVSLFFSLSLSLLEVSHLS